MSGGKGYTLVAGQSGHGLQEKLKGQPNGLPLPYIDRNYLKKWDGFGSARCSITHACPLSFTQSLECHFSTKRVLSYEVLIHAKSRL
jgi:hypothetical protein